MGSNRALLYVMVAVSAASGESDTRLPDVATAIDRHLETLVLHGFSGSVLVARDAAVLLERGYGLADRTEGIPCSARTRYDVGSVAKLLTVLLVERLERRGLLRSSDPIGRYFENVPAEKSIITVAHLVAHTSGLPRTIDLRGSERVTRASAIATMLGAPLELEPGERVSYSNVGYQLLAAIIETASERNFECALRELIAEMELSATSLYGDDPSELGVEARGYAGRRDLGWACNRDLTWAIKGAGGLVSTVGDLQKVVAGMLASDSGLSPPTIHKSAFFRGWNVNDDYLVASGAAHGFRTECRWYPDGTTVIVTCNCEVAVRNIAEEVVEIVRGSRSPPERVISAGALRAAAGNYQSVGGARFVVRSERDWLVLAPSDGAAVALLVGATPTPARGTVDVLGDIRATDGPVTFLGSREILPGVAKIWAQAGTRIAEVVLRRGRLVETVWKSMEDFERRFVPSAEGSYTSHDLGTWETRVMRLEAGPPVRLTLSTADAMVICKRTE